MLHTLPITYDTLEFNNCVHIALCCLTNKVVFRQHLNILTICIKYINVLMY